MMGLTQGWTRGTLMGVLALLVMVLLGGLHAQAQQPFPGEWDTRLDELRVTYQPAPDCTEGCWRLVSARLLNEEESAGLHHVFAKVQDEAGKQLPDHPWTVAWPDGQDIRLTKPAPDWGDEPLWACHLPDQGEQGPYRAFAGTDEAQSDVVSGLGLPYCLHMSFQLVWRWVPPGVEPPATPTPAPCVACAERIWLPLVGGGTGEIPQ